MITIGCPAEIRPKMTITNPENAVYWTSEDETDDGAPATRRDPFRSSTRHIKLNGEHRQDRSCT